TPTRSVRLMRPIPRQHTSFRQKAPRPNRRLLPKKIAMLKCATAGRAGSLPFDVAVEGAEAAEAAANLRRGRRRRRVMRPRKLSRLSLMKERSKSRRLLSRRKALALPRAGNSMLVRLMRGRMIRRGLQVTTARDRRANRALAHSGDPIHADPIRADRS